MSFLVATTEKGDAAKKVRKADNVPDLPTSDDGREFGTIKDFNIEKGWGFIIRKAGGDNARFFDKACTAGLVPRKGLCVSFVLEETEKGPSAKDLREEDPERVRRVTAKVYHGRVEVSPHHILIFRDTNAYQEYYDPTPKQPTNGYGFIAPFNPPSYGAPKR